MALFKCFANIQPMIHNERGSCIGHRSSAELRKSISRPVWQKGEHSFSGESRDAYAEKKLRSYSDGRPAFQVRTLRFNRVSPRSLGRDVSFTDLRSIQPWRIAD
jgi:hypothetical protein